MHWRPTWTEKRATHFASAMSDLVGSYEREAAPGWWTCSSRSFCLLSPTRTMAVSITALLIYLGFFFFFIIVGVEIVVFISFYCYYKDQHRASVRIKTWTCEQIKTSATAYSDERLALAYNVKEWSETHTSRDSTGIVNHPYKLLRQPQAANQAPRDIRSSGAARTT